MANTTVAWVSPVHPSIYAALSPAPQHWFLFGVSISNWNISVYKNISEHINFDEAKMLIYKLILNMFPTIY